MPLGKLFSEFNNSVRRRIEDKLAEHNIGAFYRCDRGPVIYGAISYEGDTVVLTGPFNERAKAEKALFANEQKFKGSRFTIADFWQTKVVYRLRTPKTEYISDPMVSTDQHVQPGFYVLTGGK